ncbi:MAG: hypothetical protein IJ689_06745 [Alphaproteobacteria bacterium]|nr:hypothetical protein [Alphaproteobacteria bacterium]
MKKYILMLGVAGVVLGSYCAYAGNSATMTVTATIAHDVSLTKIGDINLGTITINPAYTGTDTYWTYSDSGVINYITQGAIVSADNATAGTFTANIANPSACNGTSISCGGFSADAEYPMFGGTGLSNACGFVIEYSESENSFKVVPYSCHIHDMSKITTGNHSESITISYSAEG